MASTNIATLLRAWAITQPNSPALIEAQNQTCLSFAQLDDAVSRAAALLYQMGLRAGDPALVFQPMSGDLYVVLIALFRLGAIAVFVDPAAGLTNLERCCTLCPPKALIASTKAHCLRLRSASLRQIPLKLAIGFPLPGTIAWSTCCQVDPQEQIAPCLPETPALLTFTSGSTGQPKAALRTHGILLAQQRSLAESLTLTAGEINLVTLPIFVLANLASGVTSLIPNVDLRFPGKINAAKVIQQIQTYHPHSTAASPAFLQRLVDYCEREGYPLSSFRKVFSGGAPVFPQLLGRLQRLAPQATVTTVYGSTEAEPIAHIQYEDMHAADLAQVSQGSGLLTGQPVSQIQLRILADRWGEAILPLTQAEFDQITLPPHTVGEIVVRGTHVLSGYLHGLGDAETKFQVEGSSWHRTGDAGYVDQQGRLWLLGRCSARIQDEWGILYPFAVEAAVSQLPQVHRSAFVQHQGKRVLVLEFRSTESVEIIQSTLIQLNQQLAWASVQQFLVVPQIPVDRRHNAKIDYPALAILLEHRLKP